VSPKKLAIILLAIVILAVWGIKGMRRNTPLQEEASLVSSQNRSKELKKIQESPKVAVVLDDFGYTKRNFKALEEIDVPFTIAVLPNAPYSSVVSEYARENGIETILHLPMEPESKDVKLEEKTIMISMEPGEIVETMTQSFKDVPSATGVSNHQGSKATKNEKAMEVVLSEVKRRGLYYLDSLTTGNSACGKIAAQKEVPYVRRDLFLDDETDELYIRNQMEKAVELAKRQGFAVVIGHERPVTLKVLKETVPGIESSGIKFVHLSEIVVEEAKR
jgi:polysaccharide deacetylase 2 family uncharacterized protein YibQ